MIEPGAIVRVFGNHEDFSLLAEFDGATEPDSRERREYMLGGYYQPWDQLRMGAFYRKSFGLRHDDDWISNNGTWEWQPTNDRGEDFVILDVSPRILLAENLMGELKFRYLYDTFDSEKTLMVRPELTYVFLKEERPVWTVFVHGEFNFGLNYGARAIVEDWGYLGALYHLSPGLEVGGSYAMQWQTWGSSAAYLAKSGDPYTVTAANGFVLATLIYQFGF